MKTARPRFAILALVMALVLALTACSSGAPSGSTPNDSDNQGEPGATVSRTDLNVAVTSSMETLDPASTVSNLSGSVLKHVFEGLTEVDPSGNVQPRLAESWEISPDGKTWTFHLREGVLFHDGAPFNAAAVKANFDRLLDPNNTFPLIGDLGTITEARVVDEYTVELVTGEVFSGLPLALGHMVALMVSPDSIEQWGEELGRNLAAGTGPFQISGASLPDQVTVERFDDYWGTQPSLERITFLAAPDSATRTAMLQSREADVVIYLPSENVAQVDADPELEIVSVPSIRVFMFHLPMGLPEMQDIRVRQALNYAVDKERIAETLFGGYAKVADSAVGPGPFGYAPIDTYPYDPEKAASFLREAGWVKNSQGLLEKDGQTFPKLVVYASRGRYQQDAELVQAVAGYLQELGLTLEVRVDEFATFWPTIQEKSRDENWVVQMSWGFPTLDGAAMLCQVYNLDHYYDFGGYDNPAVNEYCAEIQGTTDTDERKQLIEQAFNEVWEDVPALYLVVPEFLVGKHQALSGVELHPGEYHSLRNARWE